MVLSIPFKPVARETVEAIHKKNTVLARKIYKSLMSVKLIRLNLFSYKAWQKNKSYKKSSRTAKIKKQWYKINKKMK